MRYSTGMSVTIGWDIENRDSGLSLTLYDKNHMITGSYATCMQFTEQLPALVMATLTREEANRRGWQWGWPSGTHVLEVVVSMAGATVRGFIESDYVYEV